MGKKTIKNMFMAVVVAAVLGIGSASAVQLQNKASILPACRGTCSATKPCFGGCLCEILTGTTGGCVRDPGPVRPPQPQKN
jgi:hypothetical protein